MPKKKAEIEIRQGGSGRELAYVGRSRVRVSDIAESYRIALDELVVDRINKSLPTLTKEQIYAGIEYWREHPAEIEKVISEDWQAIDKLPIGGAFHDLAMSAFADDWESKEDAIYDQFLDDASSQ